MIILACLQVYKRITDNNGQNAKPNSFQKNVGFVLVMGYTVMLLFPNGLLIIIVCNHSLSLLTVSVNGLHPWIYGGSIVLARRCIGFMQSASAGIGAGSLISWDSTTVSSLSSWTSRCKLLLDI